MLEILESYITYNLCTIHQLYYYTIIALLLEC